MLDQGDRPLLEGFLDTFGRIVSCLSCVQNGMNLAYGKHSVVGVEEDVGDDRPCLFPVEVLFIEEDAHQLGDGESGMGLQCRFSNWVTMRREQPSYIVELDCDIWDDLSVLCTTITPS